MKRLIVVICCLCLVAGAVAGCGPGRARSSQEAIQKSEAMKTPQEKAKYLMAQAEAFMRNKNFGDTINVTEYVIRYVDRNSEEAKKILRRAQDAMALQLQRTAEEFKKSIQGVTK